MARTPTAAAATHLFEDAELFSIRQSVRPSAALKHRLAADTLRPLGLLTANISRSAKAAALLPHQHSKHIKCSKNAAAAMVRTVAAF